MTAVTCPTCAAVQGPRVYCCPSAALDEIATLRRERDAALDEVRRLADELEIVEALRLELMRAADEEGVYLL